MPDLQSAYCSQHSTETAVLKVLSDILWTVDSGDLVALALLNLSVTFDTVDHDTLLCRQKKSYGLGSRAWLVPVLPQWSIPVCLLWRNIIDLDQAGLRCSTGTFCYDSVTSLHRRFALTGSCTRPGPPPLRRWHSDLRLLSAWWLFPAPEPCFQQHKRRGQVDAIQPTSTQCWQDWGDLVHFTTSPGSDSFCSDCHWHRCHCACLFSSRSGHLYQLTSVDANACSQIRSIRRSVTRPVLQSLVAALTLSRLDYGCCMMAGLPARQLNRRQSVLNAAAGLTYLTRRTEHVFTPPWAPLASGPAAS